MFIFSRKRQTWKFSHLRHEKTKQGERVTARVAGHPVWFESDDLSSVSAPEALMGAFLIPALHHKVALRIDAPLNATWLANIERLAEILAAWWDYPPSPTMIHCGESQNSVSPGALTGLCFTAGIDSFHCLFEHEKQIDALAFVHGFDIPLSDASRAGALLRHLHAVADATNKRLVCIRTNIREHRLFRSVSWERTHGAALAAVGHLLRCHLNTLMIASSWSYPQETAWGSHWMIDGLWSTAGFEIVPELTSASRWDKTRFVGGHPLVQQHLHVCWKNRRSSGNCSRCEKCLRTMVSLAGHGFLRHAQAFDLSEPLPALLDRLPPLTSVTQRNIWMQMSERPLPARVRAAIIHLLERSTNDSASQVGFLGRLFRAA
jgi:hypothetical protein